MKSPKKGDWATQVLKDMNEIKLNIDIQDIPKFSQSKFKNIVKSQVRLHAFKQLLDDMNKRMSEDAKGKQISYKEFDMQSYLKPTQEYISITDKKYIFKCRMNDIDVKMNRKWRYKDVTCESCDQNAQESQKHVLYWTSLMAKN